MNYIDTELKRLRIMLIGGFIFVIILFIIVISLIPAESSNKSYNEIIQKLVELETICRRKDNDDNNRAFNEKITSLG